MKKNAFTLVELLAVIVILAIVLIIAVPGVLSIINKTKDDALISQKKIIEEAARLYMTGENDITWSGTDPSQTVLSLDILKAKGYLDKKVMNPKTNKELTCAKVTVSKEGKGYGYQTELCDSLSNNPRVSSEMIPIVYDGSKWVKADVTNKNNSWFNYETQQWANVATVLESTRETYKNASINTEVKMTDINAMFVWIPRFKYKLFNVDGTVGPAGNPNLAGELMIDVELETIGTTKSKGSKNGEWLTHPAFTFGDEELSGFWVGKFEVGYKGAVSVTDAEQSIFDSSKIIVKPSVYSWRNVLLVDFYKGIQSMKSSTVFGISNTDEPHMIKSMEWGAMAYLSGSKYGKVGNVNYTGTSKEVRINNNTSYLTGCGATTENEAASDVCNTYETIQGQAASTTGNITGIYDTSGGNQEAVGGVMRDSNGVDIMVHDSGFDQTELNQIVEQGKYLNVYDYSSSLEDFGRGHLGDSSKEMGPFFDNFGAWHQDYGYLVRESGAWFMRSGMYSHRFGAGTYLFGRHTGLPVLTVGTRVVIV